MSAASLHLWSLLAWRATHPDELPPDQSAVGPLNESTIEHALASAAIVVAAWGPEGHPLKDRQASAMLTAAQRHRVQMHVLAITRRGDPGHPLRLPRSLRPRPLTLTVPSCPRATADTFARPGGTS